MTWFQFVNVRNDFGIRNVLKIIGKNSTNFETSSIFDDFSAAQFKNHFNLLWFALFIFYLPFGLARNTPMAVREKHVWQQLNCNYLDSPRIQHVKHSQSSDQKYIRSVIRMAQLNDTINTPLKSMIILAKITAITFSKSLRR